MGFTRDRQITKNLFPTNSLSEHHTSATGFYIAPTQSINVSDITFINNSKNINNCISGPGYHKMFVRGNVQTPGGVSFYDTSCQFIHTVISVSPIKDEIKIYLDSELLTTSSLVDVFGTIKYSPPQIPSFYTENSFNYKESGNLSSTVFSLGPELNSFFTPWIVGGGYSDGYYDNNTSGFMSTNSGRKSGLNGFIGSLKFYSKALNNSEVKINFNSQKSFFKNINLPECQEAPEAAFIGNPLLGDSPLDVQFTDLSE